MFVFIDTDSNISTCVMQYVSNSPVFKNCFCPAYRRDSFKKIIRNILGQIIQKCNMHFIT